MGTRDSTGAQCLSWHSSPLERSRREAEQKVLLAEADSQERVLAGRGESQKIMQIGLSEATVLLRRIRSFGDPRLYALQEVADKFSTSQQPLVPERLFVSSSPGADDSRLGSGILGSGILGSGMLGMLLQLLVAEKSGMQPLESTEASPVSELADQMTEKAMASMVATFENQAEK